LLGAGLGSLPAIARAEETPHPLSTALSVTTLSGYVDTSAQWNLGTGNANAPTYAFGGSGKADGFNLNVAKLAIEKPIEATDSWNAGYKVDLIFGPDANTLATQSSGAPADFGVKQAYVSLHTPIGNGLDFKIGVWDTIIGYEVFESYANPNVTHSYGYTIEPTTHTGIQAAYAITDTLVATVGVADTVGSKINERSFYARAESYKTYMGSLVFTAPKDWGALAGSTLCGCVINGYNPGLGADQTSWYIGGVINTPVAGLKVGASYDYLGISEQSLSEAGYANAAALYASFQATEKLSLHARGEYATSDLEVGATANVPGKNLLGAHRVVAVTGTAQYDLWKNVMSRIEFRWDHAADGSNAYGGTDSEEPGTRSNSYILLANVTYRF
jgi:hypothetical protein